MKEEHEITLESMKFYVEARHHLAQCLTCLTKMKRCYKGELLGMLEKMIKRKLEEFLGNKWGRQEQ